MGQPSPAETRTQPPSVRRRIPRRLDQLALGPERRLSYPGWELAVGSGWVGRQLELQVSELGEPPEYIGSDVIDKSAAEYVNGVRLMPWCIAL